MGFIQRFPGTKKRKKVSKRRQLIERISIISTVFLLMGLLFLYKYDPLRSGIKETGVLVNIFSNQSRYGSETRYVIALNSGEKVHVNAARMGRYKKGRMVVVEKRISKILKKKSYRFIRYIDKP